MSSKFIDGGGKKNGADNVRRPESAAGLTETPEKRSNMHPSAIILHDAAELNRRDPRRRGNMVHIDYPCRVTIGGDIHGHRKNMNNILSHGFNAKSGKSVVILQEIIHGPPDEITGLDRSIELLISAARTKVRKPEGLVFLMGNHDLAQFTGKEISKKGRGVCHGFNKGVEAQFEEDYIEILDAVNTFCESLPLAVRFSNGLVAAHSLPAPNSPLRNNADIIDKINSKEDYMRGGGVHEWTWGRDQDTEQIEDLAEKLQASCFVLGHRHIFEGRERLSDIAVTIDSSGPCGHLFEFDSNTSIDSKNIEDFIKNIPAIH